MWHARDKEEKISNTKSFYSVLKDVISCQINRKQIIQTKINYENYELWAFNCELSLANKLSD